MSKDPCKVLACALQKCLSENNYQESACQLSINNLFECCKVWKGSSLVCSGINTPDVNNERKSESKTDTEKPVNPS